MPIGWDTGHQHGKFSMGILDLWLGFSSWCHGCNIDCWYGRRFYTRTWQDLRNGVSTRLQANVGIYLECVIYHIFIKFFSRLYPDVPIPIPTSDYTILLIISYSLVLVFTCFFDSCLFCSCFQYFRFLTTSYILHSSCMLRCLCTICSELLWHSTPVLCSLFDYDPIIVISITIPIRPDLVYIHL